MNPIFQYLIIISIFMGILAGIALIYIALLGGLCWLLSRWRGKEWFRTLWHPIVLSIVVVVIAVPLFNGITGLFRYNSPGGILFGMGRLREDWQAYASVARIAFFALYGFLVALGAVVGYRRAQQTSHGKIAGITTALAVLFYLMITMPVVDFLNACIIGTPFLLPVSC